LLSDSRDIDALTSALPKEFVAQVLIEQSYEHLDFVWGMDAHILIYPSVKRLLTRYSDHTVALQ
jgi:lysosomal acid lipase/cholesteryl ester hydrolase